MKISECCNFCEVTKLPQTFMFITQMDILVYHRLFLSHFWCRNKVQKSKYQTLQFCYRIKIFGKKVLCSNNYVSLQWWNWLRLLYMVWLKLCKTKFSENGMKMQNIIILHLINCKSKFTVCDWGPCIYPGLDPLAVFTLYAKCSMLYV